MMRRPIAGGLESDCPRRRSGRRPLAERMSERTRGVMNNRHQALPTSEKRTRGASMTTVLLRWKVMKQATVPMDSTTWLGTSTSGQPIGSMSNSMRRVRSGIRRDHRMELKECSAVGHGSLNRSTCALHTGGIPRRRINTTTSGSAVPGTVRNNLYCCTLFSFR